MPRALPIVLGAAIAAALVMDARAARADGWDLSLFGGIAFPTYEQQFVVNAPQVSPVPGLVITPTGDLTIDAKGGSVFGGALAYEFGVLAIEGRFDSTAVDLRTSGVRYTLDVVDTFTGSITVAPGTLDTDRLSLLSLNLRLRTPGPVSLFASGGVSYLPSFTVSGTAAVAVRIDELPAFDTSGNLRLRVSPTESSHRFGVNAGGGLRFAVAPHVALFGEGRVFVFKEYALAVDVDNPDLQPLVSTIEQPRFKPVVVNAVGGLVFTF